MNKDIQIAKIKVKNNIQLTDYDKLVLKVYEENKKKLKNIKRSYKLKKKGVKKRKFRKKKSNRINLNPKCKWNGELTKHEKIVKEALIEMSVDHESQKIVIVNRKKYILDFFIKSKMLCIEIDGFHHFHEPYKSADKKRTKNLNKYGIKVIRFTNKEVDNDLHLVLWTIIKA